MDAQELKTLAESLLASGQAGEFLALLHSKALPALRPIEGAFGPLYRRPMIFPGVGSKIVGHTHRYDHVTVLHRGAVLVKCFPEGPEGKPKAPAKEAVFRADAGPQEILILANTFHEFTALEPDTWASCYFVHRDQLGAPVEAYNRRAASYG